MIPYADIEFAIARWKARAAGAAQPAPAEQSGMVQAEVPVATAPETAADFEPVPTAVDPGAGVDVAMGNVGDPVYPGPETDAVPGDDVPGDDVPGDDVPGDGIPEPPSVEDDEFKD